jgi:tryptophan synthase alpha chain
MMNRIQQTFVKTADHKCMSLFITAGFPTIEDTVELILGFEKNGADIIELGIPFSDPLADGPTIQYSSNLAITNGITMNLIFDMVKQIRSQSEIPLVLMGYINPMLRYGLTSFFEKAQEVGVDGLIVPDLPLDEGHMIHDLATTHGINIINLIAPNTTNERMQLADQQSSGFVYCVSVTGVTGARDGSEVQKSVDQFIERSKEHITNNPIMVGFGIKSYEDACNISKNVEGFIVGSALIENIKEHFPKPEWKSEIFDFVHRLKFGYSKGVVED